MLGYTSSRSLKKLGTNTQNKPTVPDKPAGV